MKDLFIPYKLILAFLIGILPPLAVYTQEAGEEEEETMVLSPFIVIEEGETGPYRAEESITATGFVTELADIPLSINVIQANYLEENQMFDLADAVERVPSTLGSERGNSNIRVRAFDAPKLRNGLSYNTVGVFLLPMENIERVEVVKGPNSVFFGEMSPGGLINWVTKRPRFDEESTTFSFTYGSYEYWKGVFEINKPLNDRLAVRGVASFMDTNDWTDFNFRRQNFGYASVSWRPTDKISWTVNGEINDATQNIVVIGVRSHPDYWNTSDGSENIVTWRNRERAEGRLLPTDPWLTIVVNEDFFPRGKRGTHQGPDNRWAQEQRILESELLVDPAPWLSFRQASQIFDNDTDKLVASSGFPRPNGIFDVRGLRYEFDRTDIIRFENEMTATLRPAGVEWQTLAGHEYSRFEFGRQRIRGANYLWDVNSGPNRYLENAFNNVNLAEAFANLPGRFPQSRSETTAVYWMNQLSFGENVHILAGLRNTWVDTGNAAIGTRSQLTPQIGGIFRFSGIGFYATYSEAFQPQNLVDAFGEIAPAVTGKGYEVGTKMRFFEDKLALNFAWHKQERTNIARRDFFREVDTGLSPIFIFGGVQGSAGVEWELFYTPSENLEFGLNGSRLYQAEIVSNTQNPAEEGDRLRHAPEWQLNAFGKYKITEGSLEGLTVGGTIHHVGETKSEEIQAFGFTFDPYTEVDLFLQYEFSTFNSKRTVFRVNVRNALDEIHIGSFFTYADPIRVFGTLTFEY